MWSVRKDKDWWNEKCYNTRRIMKDILAKFRVGLESAQDWKAAKREYKAAIKEAKEAHKDIIRLELDKVNNVSEGWKFIEKYRGTRNALQLNPKIKEPMVNHFKELLQGTEEAYPDATPPTSTQRILLPISEFENVVKFLKENKAAGPDNLKAEGCTRGCTEWNQST